MNGETSSSRTPVIGSYKQIDVRRGSITLGVSEATPPSAKPESAPRPRSKPLLGNAPSDRLIAFRHFCSGSLALASLNRACRNLVPTFPQRSPPSLLTTAACGGLRSASDCRPRRTYLHLSYSYASPCGPALLVTQDPTATLVRNFCCDAQRRSCGCGNVRP
jgi:hypothetical protein